MEKFKPSGSLVRRYERNTAGKDYLVGDIHGHFNKLMDELDKIGFNQETDRLFCVGDLIDRGPESEMAEVAIEHAPWFYSVLGNHEEMSIAYVEERSRSAERMLLVNGGTWNVIRDFSESVETAAIFSTLPMVIELETTKGVVGILHAEVPRKYSQWEDYKKALDGIDVSEEECRMCRATTTWGRTRFDLGVSKPVNGVRAVVVGHTPVKHGRTLGNTIYIDTGGWIKGGGWGFTILDAETLSKVN